PGAHHVAVRRQPGAPLEQPREVERAHVDDRTELGEREVLIEVLADIVGDPPLGELLCRHCISSVRRAGPQQGSASERALRTASSSASPWKGFPRNAIAPAWSVLRRASASL